MCEGVGVEVADGVNGVCQSNKSDTNDIPGVPAS